MGPTAHAFRWIVLAKKKRKPLRTSIPKVGCPFCLEWLPTPAHLSQVHSMAGLGGRCECGACFVVDETGRSGGQALLDVQTLACDGDIDKALKLREGVDFELKTKPVHTQAGPRGLPVRGQSFVQPLVWAITLK